MKTIWHDVRFGVRQLHKSPGFTIIVVLTLGIGIGANTAMFSAVNTVLLRPLPYPDSDRLVVIWETEPKQGESNFHVSGPSYQDWQRQSRSFESMALITNCAWDITHGDQSRRVGGAAVSSSFFSVLGVKPALGRVFTAQEDQPGSEFVVVLSYDLWQSQFAGDPNIIGQTITAEGGALQHTVVGVLPAAFQPSHEDFNDAQFWSSFSSMQWVLQKRGNRTSTVIARLKTDVPLIQAQTEMDGIAAQLAEQYPENRDRGIKIVPLLEEIVTDVWTTMWFLLAAVGFLLLIVCVNVANLLLVRISGREREIAIRGALGARPLHLIRQVFINSLLLAILGGGLGLLLALVGNSILYVWLRGRIPRMHDLTIDGYVLGFTALVSMLSCVLFALAPAIRLLGRDILPTLQRSGGRSTSSHFRMLQDGLVVAQLALTLVLLVGAGLLGRSFVSLMYADVGLKPENVLTFCVGLPLEQYGQSGVHSARSAFVNRLETELKNLPGVITVGATSRLPFTYWSSVNFSVKEGLPTQSDIKREVYYQMVSSGYFKAIGARLVKGRFFDDSDTPTSGGKIIINETMAQRFWPNQNPLGTHIKPGYNYDGAPASYEIIGIVADIKQCSIQEDIQPEMMWLYPERARMFTIRMAVEPMSLLKSIRTLVAGLEKTATISDVSTLKGRIKQTLVRERFSLFLYSFFSVVALLLASLGVYGVMAYAVSRRQQEIGIRIALGAQQGNILGLILKRGFLLASIGTAIGFMGALAVTRIMGSMLYEIKPLDPLTFAVVPLLLTMVTLLACYIPARRATRIDPMVALRYE